MNQYKQRMKSYSKISGKNSFIQRSNFNKEFVFMEGDFDILLSSKSTNQKHHLVHEQESSIPDQVSNKKVGFVLGKSEVATTSFESEQEECVYDGRDHHSLNQESVEQTLSANEPYPKSNNKGKDSHCHEKKSSTKAIQKAVKKAFSIKRSSDKYCKIYDQPNTSYDDRDSSDVNYDETNNIYNHQDDDLEIRGSLDTRYESMMKNTQHHKHGKSHVGSKVVRACKRLFSR